MLAFLGWFNPKRIAILIGVSAALWLAVETRGFVVDALENEKEVFRQQIVIQEQQATIETMQAVAAAEAEARVFAEAELERLKSKAAELEDIRRTIVRTNRPDASDSAPGVIQDTLELLRQRDTK